MSGRVEGAEVRFERASELPSVLGDRESLMTAFRNLIHNAVKFGDAGELVEVLARREGEEVVVEVRDKGPGIPLRERKHIFEQFYRAPGHARTKPGTGLGLAIVQRVMDGHRGRVGLESEVGVGSVFIVRLPVAKP